MALPTDVDYSRDLALARADSRRNFIVRAAANLANKLNQEIEKGNDGTAFTIALILAIAKDILDGAALILDVFLPFIGHLPGIFLTVFLSIFLFRKGWFLKTKAKVYWWLFTLVFDNIPGINAIPLNTIMVLLAWRNVRKRAKQATETLENLSNLAESKILELEQDISLLENEK